MWEISLSQQISTSFFAIIFGFILCVFYDLVRSVIKILKTGKVGVFCGDMFFWLVSTFAVFIFLLATTNGELRGYVFVSLAIGFFSFKLTLSRFLTKVFILIFAFIYNSLTLLGRFLREIFDKICLLVRFVGDVAVKSLKKCLKWVKKLLKYRWELLYTKVRKKKREGATKNGCEEESQSEEKA